MTATIKHYDNVFYLTIESADTIIGNAIKAGHKFEDLRWRVSPEQRVMILRYMRGLTDVATLRYEIEHGNNRTSGFFAGVPYIVDNEIASGAVVLDVVRQVEIVAIVRGLGVHQASLE